MRRKPYTYVTAARADVARRLRHRAACVRWRMRVKAGVRVNRPRVSDEELDRRALRIDI